MFDEINKRMVAVATGFAIHLKKSHKNGREEDDRTKGNLMGWRQAMILVGFTSQELDLIECVVDAISKEIPEVRRS
jgi:hypothetical protein